MQRLGQLILCLTLLLSALLGLGPALGTSVVAPNLPAIVQVGVPVSAVNAAHVVPLALMLIFATLILLSTPRGSGQDQ